MFKYKSINKIITAIKKKYIKILFSWKLTICKHFYHLTKHQTDFYHGFIAE